MVWDDKFLVVAAVTILGLGSLYIMGPGAKEIIQMAYSGLFGMVTGAALASRAQPTLRIGNR